MAFPWSSASYGSFFQPMARSRIQLQAIKLFQFPNPTERFLAERAIAIEGVKHNSFEQIAKCKVVVFGERLQYFQKSLLDSNPGLYTVDGIELIAHRYQCTMVPT